MGNTKGVVKELPTYTLSFVSSDSSYNFSHLLEKYWSFDGIDYQKRGTVYAEIALTKKAV